MRVTKTTEGQFVVEDEPMCLAGEAAEQFMSNMTQLDAAGSDQSRKRFLAECAAAYSRVVKQSL